MSFGYSKRGASILGLGLGFALGICRAEPSSAAEPARETEVAAAVPQPSGTVEPMGDQPEARTEDLRERRQNYEFQPDEICPFCLLTPQFPRGRAGLHWHEHWGRVGWPEFVITPVLVGTTLAVRFAIDTEDEADWQGPILFDSAVRDVLAFESASGRKAARTISDVLFFGSILHPVLVDNFIAAWWLREAPEVAWQLFVINTQAYAFTLALNTVTKRFTARARPWDERCEAGSTEFACDSQSRFSAFYSGHAAVTATGAGLLCAHHTQLSLYRNDVLDTGSCLLGIAGTLVTGATRVASDSHWASDVIVGHFMGYVSGYLLPTLIYYREFRFTPEPVEEHPAEPAGPKIAVVPLLSDRSLKLMAIGMF